MLRQNRDIRGVRQNIEQRTDATDGTDAKAAVDAPHIIARDQLIPRIEQRNKHAVAVDRVDFFLYQRKQTGRRCSCFNVETQADGKCQVCHGTGIVGGFEKYGTRSNTFDVTHPNTRMVNVRIAYDLQTRPVIFQLEDQALNGYVEATVDILQSNCRKCDRLLTVPNGIARGNKVEPFIRSPGEVSFVPLTDESFVARLDQDAVIIRVNLSRTDFDKPVVGLSHLFLRYFLLDNIEVRGDLQQNVESITLAEFGIYDSFASIPIFFDSTVKNFSTEDFLLWVNAGRFNKTRWKIIEVSRSEPLRRLVSTTATARLVQEYEAYIRVP